MPEPRNWKPPVRLRQHPRTVRIEYTDNLDPHSILAVIVHKQCLCTTLAFIITRTEADWIYISPITFHLGMNNGVTVHFAGRGLQYLGIRLFGQFQHIDGAQYRSLDSFNSIVLIMDRRSGASQVINFVDFCLVGNSTSCSTNSKRGLLFR